MEHIERISDTKNKIYSKEFIDELSQYLKKDVNDIVYKRVYGEEKTIKLGNKNFTLLPIGNINLYIERLLEEFNLKGEIPHIRGTHSISSARRIVEEKLKPIIINDASIDDIRTSYINHYKNALGEEWSNEDFDKRLDSLSYKTYKYARNEETGKVFIVGFFGAQVATGAGGKYLTSGELYVLPQFRSMGIATELVNQTFNLALEDGINGFDSLTYKVANYNPLKFWKDIGANNTELYHISGDIKEMVSIISHTKDRNIEKDSMER